MSEESTPGSGESFGDYLRRNREASGKTLDGISRSTRISKRYLVAFEENDLKKIPDEAFARGFLKTFARELGIDVDDCLARYDAYRKSLMPTQIKDIRKMAKLPSPNVSMEPFEFSHQQKWIVMVLAGGGILAALILCTIWIIQKVQAPEEKHSSSTEVVDEALESPDDTSVVPEEGTAPNTVALKTPQAATIVTPIKPSILTIKASKDSKLSIRVDEASLQEIVIKAGETQTVNVFKDVEIRSSDRSGLGFQYNGKPLDISGPVIKLFNRNLFTGKK